MYDGPQPKLIVLKLRKRMVLTISIAGISTIGERGDGLRAGPGSGYGQAKTVAAATPAAGGLGMPDEVPFVELRRRLDVEAREPHRGRRDVEEARRPADAARASPSPQANARTAGASAERDHVGERVELDAERAGRARSAARCARRACRARTRCR